MKKKNPITSVADVLCFVEKQITWVCFFIMLLVLAIQVLCRYVFDAPLAWAEEMVRYIYLAISFVGAAIAVRENSHICINVLPNIVRKITKNDEKKEAMVLKITDIFAALVGAIFWAWMTLQFIVYDMDVMAKAQISVANQWPMWLVYTPVIVASVLMTLHYVLNIVELIIKKVEIAEPAAGTEK